MAYDTYVLRKKSERVISRLKNPAERAVAEKLFREGYAVFRRGWPDFFAVKDGDLRLIEVKPRRRYSKARLSANQQFLADLFREHFGVVVELVLPDDVTGGMLRDRKLNPRAIGSNPRSRGTNPRAIK